MTGSPAQVPASTGKRIQSADRVVDILEFLATVEDGRASLSQVSTALGLQPSTAHHLLATLRARRLIAQDAGTKQYSLGERLIELGQLALRSVDLVTLARPAVHALHAATGQNSCFVAFRGCHRSVLVREIEQGQAFRPLTHLPQGAAPPPTQYGTAAGKLLLAYLPEGELQQYLHTTPLYRYTDRTITSVEALQAELERIRQRELATDAGEWLPQLACLAAPVRDASQRVIGCLDMTYPLDGRLDQDMFARVMSREAHNLTERLQALGFRYD